MSSKISKHLFVFIAALICSAFFWEYMVRIFSPQKISPNYHTSNFGIPNALLPNHKVELKNYKGYPPYIIETNKYGLRMSKDVNYEKPENTFRIMCFGDSVLFGSGVNAEEMYTSQLEALLNENRKDKHYEVIPAAVEGWGPLEFYTYFKNEGNKYSPDLIILNNFVDDIKPYFTKFITFKSINKKGDTIFLEKMEVDLRKSTFIKLLFGWMTKLPVYNELSRFSHALYLIRFNLFKASSKEKELIKKKGFHLNEFLRTVDLKDISKFTWSLDGSEMKLPKIRNNPLEFFGKSNKQEPSFYQANTVLYYLLMDKFLSLIKKHEAKTIVLSVPSDLVVYKMILPAPRLPLKSLQNIDYNFDLLTPFQKMQSYEAIQIFFPKDYHWAPSGHRLAAQSVFQFLTKEVLPPFSKPINLSEPQNILYIQKANKRIEKHLNDSPFKLFLKGMIMKNKGSYKEAEKFFRSYIEKEPEDYEAHFQFGMFLFENSNFDEAETHFRIALKGHPLEKEKYLYAYNFSKLLNEAKKLFLQKRYDDALSWLEKAKKLKGPWLDKAFSFMINIYMRIGDHQNAELYIDQSLKYWPNKLIFRLMKASLKFELRKYNEAKNAAAEVIKLNKNDLKALLILGLSHYELGNRKEAEYTLAKYLKRDPNNKFAKETILALKKKEYKDAQVVGN
jgi:tetratricopeptide (TPR) repeat protein